MQHKISVLDLYCGLGGLSMGFEMTESFETLAGIDWYQPAIDTFYSVHRSRHPLFETRQDISKLSSQVVLDALGERPDVIVGGPPCQGFSAAGKRLESYEQDPRNQQVFEYLRFVREIRPRVFLMENVSGIRTTGQSRKNQLLDDLVTRYEELGYAVTWQVVNSADFRVPQRRLRFIMIGVADAVRPFRFPDVPCGKPSDLFRVNEPFLTAKDALSDLPSPRSAEPQEYTCGPLTPLQFFLRRGSGRLYNHLITKHSDVTVKKLENQEVGSRLYDWNHSWIKLDPATPAPTVKMNNRAPAVHYAEPRLVSPRECARLQTIPDRVVIAGNKTQQLTQVGNAVPSIMAAHLATAIAEQCFEIVPVARWDAFESPLAKSREAVGSSLVNGKVPTSLA